MHEIDIEGGSVPILRVQEERARRVEAVLRAHAIRAANVMGAVGSGKTSLIEGLVRNHAGSGVRFGAIAGDVAGTDDCRRFQALGIPAVAIETRGDCHLDAHRVLHALESLPLDALDFIFIENVGNLVCPADFPLGCDLDVVVISVTEGDDMVRKHPRIFATATLLVLNKVDLAAYMEIDPERIVADYRRVNPHGTAIQSDARSGRGLPELGAALGFAAGGAHA